MIYAIYQWNSLLQCSAGWFVTAVVVESYHTLETSPSIDRASIYHFMMSTPSCTTNHLGTGKHYNYRHWYINECRCRGSMLWPMSPAYYHQMAVNLWVSKNIDRRILYYVPPTRATGPLQSLRVTFCMDEVRRKQIYSIEWELRWWFSACHCERNVSLYDARCTITNETWGWYSFSFCTQQSTVGLPYAICMMIYA